LRTSSLFAVADDIKMQRALWNCQFMNCLFISFVAGFQQCDNLNRLMIWFLTNFKSIIDATVGMIHKKKQIFRFFQLCGKLDTYLTVVLLYDLNVTISNSQKCILRKQKMCFC
jgi:hypothetical protein